MLGLRALTTLKKENISRLSNFYHWVSKKETLRMVTLEKFESHENVCFVERGTGKKKSRLERGIRDSGRCPQNKEKKTRTKHEKLFRFFSVRSKIKNVGKHTPSPKCPTNGVRLCVNTLPTMDFSGLEVRCGGFHEHNRTEPECKLVQVSPCT